MASSIIEALKRIFIPVERDDNEPEPQQAQEPQQEPELKPAQKPIQEFPQEKKEPEPEHDEAAHVVQVQEEVVEHLIAQLQALHGKEDQVKGLKLWTTDTVTALALKGNDFNKLLRLRLDDAGFEKTQLTGREVIVQPAPEGARSLGHGVSFTLSDDEPASTVVRARITLSEVSGYGTLAQPCYILDTALKTEFRVGRGRIGSRDAHWVNDIVVRDDDSDDVMRHFNSYVSSQQALLIARDGRFFLQATPFGCRDTGGCATKIISGTTVRELTDTAQLHLLHDGDIIELGTRVRLAVSFA